MAKISLQTPTARARLAPRGMPYKVRLLPGVHLGYRAAQSGTGAWVVIAANGKGDYWTKKFANADGPNLPADGSAVLSYEQAANKCRALARGDANAATDAPVSIAQALDAYEADLLGRGRAVYNGRWVRHHLPAHLAAQPLSQVTGRQLRAWRDGLIKSGVTPTTVNRMLKGARAAFKLTAKLDPRVAANVQAWQVGLEAFPNTVKARDAVLNDGEVMAVVRAAYDIDECFGRFIQAHAETGSRSSQLMRCVVGDLHGDRLMVSASRKGRNGGRGGQVSVPLTPGLAERLRKATADRAADEPLFVRADGTPWRVENDDHRRPFARAVQAAGLPVGTSIYSLRHSSIARQLKRSLPIRLVAAVHDTSVPIIEAHYGRFIADHSDDLVRAALLDTSPPAESASNVTPLRA